MPLLNDDMSTVPAPSEAVDEGWYHVRISQVNVTKSDSTGQPCVKLLMRIQSEGPMFGRTVPDTASLQPHALFKLKGYYQAVGYKPGPEGHDPEKLLDTELYVYVMHDSYQGQATIKIPPYSIRSVNDGPGKGTPGKGKSAGSGA
jgi:hypothetical protein